MSGLGVEGRRRVVGVQAAAHRRALPSRPPAPYLPPSPNHPNQPTPPHPTPPRPVSIEQELADVIANIRPLFTAREIIFESSYDGPDLTYFLDHTRAPTDEEKEAAA